MLWLIETFAGDSSACIRHLFQRLLGCAGTIGSPATFLTWLPAQLSVMPGEKNTSYLARVCVPITGLLLGRKKRRKGQISSRLMDHMPLLHAQSNNYPDTCHGVVVSGELSVASFLSWSIFYLNCYFMS